MPGLDSLTSALDTASQALAGGTNNPTDATTGDSKYLRGIHIDEDDNDQNGSTAHNRLNERDLNLLLEFIHFGNVHTSYSNFFPHDSYQDNKKEDKIQDGDKPRAIQFRSALEREAVVLGVFMESTQAVLQERTDSGGALGTALNTLGSLTGAGGGGSGQTTAADVNAPVQKVVAAVQPLLGEQITYTNTHQAGMDLNQARADYRALLTKISKEDPSSNSANSLLGGAMTSISSGLSSAGGSLGDIINFAQGVAFKPQDIKVKFHVLVAIQQEPQIETACHAMTLKAISDGINPVLPVWMGGPKKQAKWDSAPASPLSPVDRSNLLAPVINPVANTVTDARNSAVGAANDVKSFFEEEAPDPPPPGTEFIDTVFDVPKPDPHNIAPMPMEMGALAVQAFLTALGRTTPINPFCADVIRDVFAVTLDFIHGMYTALLIRSPDDPIADATLYKAAQDDLQIVQRLISLAGDKVAFIRKAQDFSVSPVSGYDVGVGQLIDKEGNKLEDMITDKIGPVMDKVLRDAMKGLAEQLELARTDANTNTCVTMEWYLGRLPWIEATLFCDLFFPFWNALLECVMNVVDPAVASVIKSITKAAQMTKGVVDSTRDAIVKGQAIYQAADGANVFDPSTIRSLSNASQTKADAKTAPAADRGTFTVPVAGRTVTGTGVEVEESEYDQVKTKHQWGDAHDPADDDKKKDDASTPAASTGASGSDSTASTQ